MAINEKSLGLYLDPHEFAYLTGKTFRGLTISERADGYNIIMRAYDRRGKALYAMITASHPVIGLLQLLNGLSGKGGEVLWRHDKYAR